MGGLFDFDEVLAAQRERTYSERDAALAQGPAETLQTLATMCEAVVGDILSANWPTEGGMAMADDALAEKLVGKLEVFFPGCDVTAAQLSSKPRAEAEAVATSAARAAFHAKATSLDGAREGLAFEAARYLHLLQTDNLWKGHMKAMGFVKDFAGLKVYNQEDPLDVYRREGLALYDSMRKSLRQNVLYSFMQY